jgi:RNA polymerase sigma factor (sigma-70 family)
MSAECGSTSSPDRLVAEARAGSTAALNALLVLLDERIQADLKDVRLRDKSPSRSNVDFLQDSLLRVRGHFHTFRGDTFEQLAHWTWKIFYRRHYETRRNRRTRYSDAMKRNIWAAVRAAKNLSDPQRLDKRVEEEFVRREEVDRVYAAFEQRLTPDERYIIELRLVDDLPYETIAAAVNRSSEAVRKAYKRAIDRLREVVESDGQPST